MDNEDLIIKGIEALNRVPGPSGAPRFLTLLRQQPTDYVETSRRLDEGDDVPRLVSAYPL